MHQPTAACDEDNAHDGGGKRRDASQLSRPLCSASLPVEQRLRSRIDKFLAGYGLTRMGKAVALSWVQVGSEEVCLYEYDTGHFLISFIIPYLMLFDCCTVYILPLSSRSSMPQRNFNGGTVRALSLLHRFEEEGGCHLFPSITQ